MNFPFFCANYIIGYSYVFFKLEVLHFKFKLTFKTRFAFFQNNLYNKIGDLKMDYLKYVIIIAVLVVIAIAIIRSKKKDFKLDKLRL